MLRVDVLPFEREDFTETRTSEHEQTDGSDCPRRCAFIPLRLSQGVSEACQFGFTKEPLATALAVFLDVPTRIGTIGPQPVLLGPIEEF